MYNILYEIEIYQQHYRSSSAIDQLTEIQKEAKEYRDQIKDTSKDIENIKRNAQKASGEVSISVHAQEFQTQARKHLIFAGLIFVVIIIVCSFIYSRLQARSATI